MNLLIAETLYQNQSMHW